MSVRIRVKTLDARTKRADIFAYNYQIKKWVDVASVYCDKTEHDPDTGMFYLILGSRVAALWAPGEYENIEYADEG